MNDATRGRSAETDPSPETPDRPPGEAEQSPPPHDTDDAQVDQRDRELPRQRDEYGPL